MMKYNKGSSKDIEWHQKYLAKVPKKFVEAKMKDFGLKVDAVQVESLVCRGRLDVTPREREFEEHVYRLGPHSLEELKRWLGIPDDVYLQRQNKTLERLARPPSIHMLPMDELRFKFEALDNEQRSAVLQWARFLLYGPTYEASDKLDQPPWSGVVSYMLERAKGVNLFVAPDLIVCRGDVVTFNNFPMLYFNNVLVYGNGRIRMGNNVKLHAHSIRHVP